MDCTSKSGIIKLLYCFGREVWEFSAWSDLTSCNKNFKARQQASLMSLFRELNLSNQIKLHKLPVPGFIFESHISTLLFWVKLVCFMRYFYDPEQSIVVTQSYYAPSSIWHHTKTTGYKTAYTARPAQAIPSQLCAGPSCCKSWTTNLIKALASIFKYKHW